MCNTRPGSTWLELEFLNCSLPPLLTLSLNDRNLYLGERAENKSTDGTATKSANNQPGLFSFYLVY